MVRERAKERIKQAEWDDVRYEREKSVVVVVVICSEYWMGGRKCEREEREIGLLKLGCGLTVACGFLFHYGGKTFRRCGRYG